LFNDVLLFFFTNITIAKQGMFAEAYRVFQSFNR
jgi:hypothetical protein